ncbi:TPA: transglycosylase SLT domain-containing protein, partial [Klebsiella pneumoniae]
MNAETLKDFLISLGFKVDEAGARKFDAVVAGTTLKAIELGVKVEAAALSVVAFTAKIASGLDDLYWASQRTGATVEGIKQIGYAVSQVGGSVDGARGSLENLARFMRNNPGAEGFLNRLGVQTRDASGNMRDMATIFTGVGQRLSSMPYYRANQYAQMLGLDENTLMAMRRGIGQFSGEYTAMAKAIGYNADVAAVSSNKFMTSLRSFGLMAGMARDKIGSNLANGLAGSIDTLRRQIMENFPKIEGAITAGVKGVLWFGEIIGRVVYRLIQLTGDIINWWKSLGTETRQVIEVFGALMIAWRLLNSAFAMSPIGRVIMLGAALIGLYDDYRTWKEGGQSLIDWGKWEPGIKYAQKAFASLSKDFGGIYVKVKDLGSAIVDLGKRFLEFINIDTSKFNGKWLFDQIIESVRSSIKILGSLVDALRKVISGDFSGAWDSLKGAAAAWSDSPVIQGAASVGQGLWDKAVDWWNGDATQYGQSVKRPSPSKAGAQLLGWMAPMMGKLEAMYNLPSGLLRSVAITESGGNQFAVSGAGAQGMFQFMPGTARDMGLRGNDVFDPIKSAEAAA